MPDKSNLLDSDPSGDRELTNFTTDLRKRLELAEGLFRECEKHAKDLHGVDLAPLALFRHIMQMADGIVILAEANSSAPMFPLLRSMVEGLFSLYYIIGTESDTKDWEQRSLAWLVFSINQTMALDEMIDPTTTGGEKFKSELRARCGSVGQEIINHLDRLPNPKNRSRPLHERLMEPDLVELQEEYKKRKRKPSYFFQLVDAKIQGIYCLAKVIGHWPEYKIFYKPFSHRVHCTDFLNLLEVKGSEEVRFGELRTIDEQEFLVALAESLLHVAGTTLAQHQRSELSNPR